MERQNFLGWSFPVGVVRGVPVRIDWTLIIVELFTAVSCLRSGRAAFLPIALAVPLASVVLHAWVHARAARLFGGRMSAVTLWAAGDFAVYDSLPVAPWPNFAVGIAGPLANALVYVGMAAWMRYWPSMFPSDEFFNLTFGPLTLLDIAVVNLGLALINLVPSTMFDGGRIWRAVLWPWLGLRRAARVTIIGGFVSAAIFLVLGVYQTSLLTMLFGACLLLVSIFEHRSLQNGHEVVTGIDPTYVNAYRRDAKPSWLARWREARRRRRQERTEQEEAREQEVLDRLLAKVSAEGLPSLTAGERAELHRISEKQKKRLQRA